MADNPISWLFLTIIGLYFVFRFLRSLYIESEKRRIERERGSQEIFFENTIDKSNVAAYNRYINTERKKH